MLGGGGSVIAGNLDALRDSDEPGISREYINLLRHDIPRFLHLKDAVLNRPYKPAALASLGEHILCRANKAEAIG